MSNQPDCLGDKTTESVDEFSAADVIYLHFNKAVNTVNHLILVSKLGLKIFMARWLDR